MKEHNFKAGDIVTFSEGYLYENDYEDSDCLFQILDAGTGSFDRDILIQYIEKTFSNKCAPWYVDATQISFA